ncbi:MAG: hypothetical protein ACTSP4_03955, partial [Candidatus Hodarchaeales archaeon]
GRTWHKSDTGLEFPIFTGLFIDAWTILIAGGTRYGCGGGIAISEDGGTTWQSILSSSSTFLTSVFLPSGDIVLGGSKGAIVKYFLENGTFKVLKVPTEGWISSVVIKEGTLTVITQKGGLYTSGDGCKTWTGIEYQGIQFYKAILDGDRFLVTGYDFYQKKGILYGIMGDRITLEELYKRPMTEITALESTPNGNVWLVGYSGMILKSTGDYDFINTSTIDNVLNDIVVNEKGIWVVGHRIIPENEAYPGYRPDVGMILYSANGTEWMIVCRFYGTDIKSIEYQDEKWFAVGSNGVLLLSENGFFWNYSSNLRTSSNLLRISFTSRKIGGILGDNGFFSLTVDGGETWIAIELEVLKSWNANDFVMLPNGSVIFTGMNHLKMACWNGNTNDSTRVTSLFTDFKRIISANNTYIYATGDYGTIIYSTDGGSTWIKIDNLPDTDMIDIAGSATEIMAVGRIGTIVQLSVSGDIINITSGTRINTYNSITYSKRGEEGTWWVAGSMGIVIKRMTISDSESNALYNENETVTVSLRLSFLYLMIPCLIAINRKHRYRKE